MVAPWVDTEFSTLDLGDKRRDRRARLIVDRLQQIAESTADACRGNAFLAATYRFASNPAIGSSAILQAHHQAAIERTSKHDTVVLSQDTTVVDLTKPKQQVRGAGPLESPDKRGFFFHPLYASSEQGLPLGLVDHVIWTREELRTDLSRKEKQRLRRLAAFEEKESARWLEMYQSGEQIALANPQTHYILVADSESDICEIHMQANDLADNYDFVVRGCQNHRILGSEGEPGTIDEALDQAEFQYDCTTEVSERIALISNETRPRRKSRSSRLASISVRAREVTLRGPARTGGKLPSVMLNVVEAIETNPPEGEEPIRWILLTTLPISSVLEIKRVISLYSQRWSIELYFKTIKSGLGVEKMKYQEMNRYLNAFSLLAIVGWRVEQLKGAARQTPNASCEEFIPAEQWKPAMIVNNPDIPLPETPPTIGEFMLLVARMGGYINKKSQGPPGSITIWRGLRRVDAYADAFVAFNKANSRCVG